ncbi:adaptin ear-binding coat-associated protein 1 NECAP-1 [Venturia nashicola]|uniref:Adaptin ear-binding coat-associated protein 1 NECAP-1 n=1 Tax=Venturia nashicola TaxID=86259 RepID=A0A4Z1PJ03_9PEZI|nr:adaptin ear-binding coat-associated protein 1 NECAP-1 [Venturia nashicola]TLD37847.1 adaptin ear-binding coat-associated protein 1 NECAP-1 [Venturia nashicola]
MDKDPITQQPYPPDAIQRILHISPKVHVYRIPPINSTKGFAAATWTQNPADLIFTARLRVVETAIPPPASAPADTPEKVSTTLLLEDPKTGQLFAASPYTTPAVVEQALDSSRFFAIRVVGEGGMKATLGIGFEERPEAFDFGVCLQDVQKVLAIEATNKPPVPGRRGRPVPEVKKEVKKDYSLKEGEMIKIDIGGRSRRSVGQESEYTGAGSGRGGLFGIPPPPGKGSSGEFGSGSGDGIPFLPPPPNARDIKNDRRKSREVHSLPKQTAADMGFDDGEFGEFQ